jgi:hypothetical protein
MNSEPQRKTGPLQGLDLRSKFLGGTDLHSKLGVPKTLVDGLVWSLSFIGKAKGLQPIRRPQTQCVASLLPWLA